MEDYKSKLNQYCQKNELDIIYNYDSVFIDNNVWVVDSSKFHNKKQKEQELSRIAYDELVNGIVHTLYIVEYKEGHVFNENYTYAVFSKIPIKRNNVIYVKENEDIGYAMTWWASKNENYIKSFRNVIVVSDDIDFIEILSSNGIYP